MTTTLLKDSISSEPRIRIPETAMVFAAGFGKRMRPITDKIPKPLVKVNGKSMLDYRLDKLVEIGVKRAVINTHYLAEQIHQFVETRDDIEVILSHEKEILDTAGGLIYAREHIGDDPIYIVNCDVIWLDYDFTPALQRLAESWDAQHMDMLMLLHETTKAYGYKGVGDFDLHDRIVIKPDADSQPYIYAGVQLFNPKLLDGLELSVFSLSSIFKNALNPSHEIYQRMHGVVHQGDWLHVDSHESLAFAKEFLQKL